MSMLIEDTYPGVMAAYDHFQAALSTEFFLCINTARIPLDKLDYPSKVAYSPSGMTGSSPYYSVQAYCDKGIGAPNQFSQEVLTYLLSSPSTTFCPWREALSRVPMFSLIRKCEGLVDRHLAFDAVLNDCLWLKSQAGISKTFAEANPFLGIYAPSPISSHSTGSRTVFVQMPSFDVHFPVKISKDVTVDQFARFWSSIRTHFAQKTAVALTKTATSSGDEYSVVFYGPPEQTTTSPGCVMSCRASGRMCEAVGMKEAHPEFSIGKLKKWRILPSSGELNYNAIWRSIAVLASPVPSGGLEPPVLSLTGGIANPVSLHDFWEARWSGNSESSPAGCTFTRPSLDINSATTSIEVFISGNAADFFRLLFQPVICRQEQIRYLSHKRTTDCIEICVDIPSNTKEPSSKSQKMLQTGWGKFHAPSNYPTDIHPANSLTPQQWEALFTDSNEGIVF